MSLFEDNEYRWRETCFVLFHSDKRPRSADVRHALEQLKDDIEIREMQADSAGFLESLTMCSASDFSAMDISYVSAEDVSEQMEELLAELEQDDLTREDQAKRQQLAKCNARFDVFHFERIIDQAEEDEFLDPGSLLLVMEELARLCHGVGVDPQSGTLI